MAGVDVGTAYLQVVPSARGFADRLRADIGGGMESAGRSAGTSASKGFGGAFKAGVAGVIAGLGLEKLLSGAIGFAKDSIGEAREAQKVGALTAQVIKTTGGAAKISAAQVGDLATAISNKTGVDDEAIQSGANLLLTFKNVKNEVGKGANIFDRATAAAADLSAAGFGDMATTSKQLGKALNDPLKGITALSRSGVTFTAQQKKQIETLVASGKTLEAQKIILGEVESQVGGAAAASSTAGEKMAVAWGNFKEGIGTSLLPFLDKAQNLITTRFLPGLQGVIDILFKGDFTKGFRDAFKLEEDSGAVDFLFKIRDGFKGLVGGVRAFGAAWKANDGDVTSSGFAGFMEKAANAAHKVFDYLKTALPPIWESAKKLWPSIKEIGKQLAAASATGGVSTFGLLKAALEALPGVLNTIAPLLEDVAKWMGENKDVVAALVVALGSGVATFRVITTVVKAYTAIQALLNVVMAANPIGLLVIAIAALVAGIIYVATQTTFFQDTWKVMTDAIGEAWRWVWNSIIAPVIRWILEGFAKMTEGIASFLRGLSNIPGFGWAKTAADKLDGAAKKAHELADGIKDIPAKKAVTVTMSVEARATALALKAMAISSTGSVTAKLADIADRRAGGGPVSARQPVWVGDNPDGSLNRTSELWVPDRPGTILNQRQLAAMGVGGGMTVHNTFNTPTSPDAVAEAIGWKFRGA